jgi:hypothetical protein
MVIVAVAAVCLLAWRVVDELWGFVEDSAVVISVPDPPSGPTPPPASK